MSKSTTKKQGRVMWGFIYVVVFLTAFLASVVMKMTADPFHGKYTVKWDESVGTVYADLSYGEGAANKFDLYVPAGTAMVWRSISMQAVLPPGTSRMIRPCCNGSAPRAM